MAIFATQLALGQVTRGDAVVVSMTQKTGTTIVPGDLVKVAETSNGNGTDPKQVEVDKVSSATDCIYGVATLGIQGGIVPIVTSGHVVASVDSATFTDAGVGKCLCTKPPSHCCLILVQKLKALKLDGTEETNSYEVKL